MKFICGLQLGVTNWNNWSAKRACGKEFDSWNELAFHVNEQNHRPHFTKVAYEPGERRIRRKYWRRVP